jgi:hypothetical protein
MFWLRSETIEGNAILMFHLLKYNHPILCDYAGRSQIASRVLMFQ